MRNNTKLKKILKLNNVIGISYNSDTYELELSLIDLTGKRKRKQFTGISFSEVINKAFNEVRNNGEPEI